MANRDSRPDLEEGSASTVGLKIAMVAGLCHSVPEGGNQSVVNWGWRFLPTYGVVVMSDPVVIAASQVLLYM